MRSCSFFIAIFGLVTVLNGCSTTQRSNYYKEPSDQRPAVDDKYRLSADRKKLEELRSEVPVEKQKENDESAVFLQLMGEVKIPPSDVRSKFDTMLRKKREVFQKDMQKERESFNKAEQKKRDVFLKEMDSERKDFTKLKHSKEERDDFFSGQETKRKEFFDNQRERRQDFESDITERRRNFEDYAREKTNEFNQEWRAYQKRYEENEKRKKAEKDEKLKQQRSGTAGVKSGSVASGSQNVQTIDPSQTDEVQSFLKELEDAYQRQGTSLESGN